MVTYFGSREEAEASVSSQAGLSPAAAAVASNPRHRLDGQLESIEERHGVGPGGELAFGEALPEFGAPLRQQLLGEGVRRGVRISAPRATMLSTPATGSDLVRGSTSTATGLVRI